MQKSLAGVFMVVLIVVGMTATAHAQLGVGIKIPPLILPQAFVSYQMSDNLLIEATATLSGLGAASALGAGAVAKLYFDPLDLGDIMLRPFAGAGANLTIVSVNVLGVSSTSLAIAANGLGGIEYSIPDSPFSIFAELGLGAFVSPAFGIWFHSGIGARFDFALGEE